MKEKINLYWGLIILLFITILYCSFYKLIYPDYMMRTCEYIFDQYNTAGIVWTFWKVVGGVTRVMALVTIFVTLLAIVGGFCRFVVSRRLAWVSILLNALNVLWLFGLTLAETNETVLRFFVRIFTYVCHVEYNPSVNLAEAVSQLNYFGNRSFVLCMIAILLIICVLWLTKSKNEERVSIGYYIIKCQK